MSERVLNMGVDLGTSRSSVSSSDGVRRAVDSYVGWPTDMVARKVLKKEVLVGREAIENRLMLDLHRPLERGLIKEGSEKDALAVRELLRHLVALAAADADPYDLKIQAVVGVPAEALRVNKRQLREAMHGIVDSLMIVSEPFAVAYGLEALTNSLIIDVGAGTCDFCVMNGRYPREEDQRTLTLAGDHVDAQLHRLIEARYPEASVTEHMAREWKERFSFVGMPPEAITVKAPVQGRPTTFDITETMKQACESLLPAITETMLDLISRVDPDYQERVRENVILSGGSGLIRGFGLALQGALEEIGGGRVRVVADPFHIGSDGGLALALDAPASEWERLAA
ncbi:MAG: rod shape-determining protein [Acidobacteriota bacterium]